VRREVEKTVVPERKGARVGARVTKARSKEVGNTAEAMSKGAKDKQRSRKTMKKSAVVVSTAVLVLICCFINVDPLTQID
jgi:hypothetical protein